MGRAGGSPFPNSQPFGKVSSGARDDATGGWEDRRGSSPAARGVSPLRRGAAAGCDEGESGSRPQSNKGVLGVPMEEWLLKNLILHLQLARSPEEKTAILQLIEQEGGDELLDDFAF